MKNSANLYFLTLLILLQALTACAQAQVYGCTDPAAINFNPEATVSDGSCTYPRTIYTPPVKAARLSAALQETSGLQWAGGSLWSINDGGHAAVLFRVDTTTGAVLQTVNLGGTTNVDWEDIAFDGTHLYIGDFGNNGNGAREDLSIYKFPLSAITDYKKNKAITISAKRIERIRFTYSNQEQPPAATGVNNTKFDCEAMIVDEGKIHLFTKNWVAATTTHYVIDGTGAGTYLATPVETLPAGYLVTAADKVPGADTLILIGYQNRGTGAHFMHLLTGFSKGLYFNGNKRRIELPSAAEVGQVEGITFRTGHYGYISNEKFARQVFGFTLEVDQKLHAFDTRQFSVVK